MNYKAKKFTALLLSLMMILVSVFGSALSVYAVEASENDSDQSAVEQTIEDQTDDKATGEEEITSDAPEATEPTEEVAEDTPAADTEGESEEVAKEEVIEESPEEAVEEPSEEEVIEEEAEEAAFDETARVDGVKIRVTADAGVFPKGSTLEVKKVELSDEQEAAVENASGDAKVAKKYDFDITIKDAEGNEIQPEGKANVSFETEEVADDTLKAEVIHIDDEDNAEALDVETKGETATVETNGFSLYSLVFTHVDTGSMVAYNTTMAVGQTTQLWTILNAVGITPQTHGSIRDASSDNSDILYVYNNNLNDSWYVEARSMDSNQHRLTVVFNNGAQEQILITAHRHNWIVSGGGTAEATVKCDEDLCAYNKAPFTASISASDATYDGNHHGASRTLSNGFPTGDVQVSSIYYTGSGIAGETTESPVNAGTYNAFFYVTPQGGTAYKVTTSFRINKANITFTAPQALSPTYDGTSQVIHGYGTASHGIMVYADGDTTDKTAFSTNRIYKKNAGTYTISYYVPGDANYNDSPIRTITSSIKRREVTVTGITARDKTYDGTDVAELVTGGANFVNKIHGDTLEVTTTTGKFSNKKVGDGKEVTFTVVLGGESASNYYLGNGTQTTTQANITPKDLTINWYGGGNVAYTGSAVLPSAVLERSTDLKYNDGLAYTTDDVTVTVEQIDNGKEKPSVNIGTGYEAKAVRLVGNDASNYTINSGNVTIEYNIVEDAVSINWKNFEDKAVTVQYNGYKQKPEIERLEGIQPADAAHVHARLVEADKEGKKDVGSYELYAELYADEGYEDKLANYALDNTGSVRFVITKAPLTITASGWLTYGQFYTDDDAHVKIEGATFLGEDNIENSLDTSNMEYNSSLHQQFAPVGEYTIKADDIKSQNYDITYEKGKLTVYPKPVVLEWYDNNGKRVVDGDNRYTYDGEEYTLTAKVAGTNEDGKISYETNTGTHTDTVLVSAYDGAQARTDANLNAAIAEEKWDNPYVVNATELSNRNYTLLEDPHASQETKVISAHQDWFIDPRPVILAWDPASMVYNAKDQWDTEKAVISNIVGEDDVTLVYNTEEARNVGDYTKKVTELDGADKDNYTLYQDNIYLEGDFVPTAEYTWSITKAPLTVKATGWISYGEKAEGTPAESDIKNADKEKGADFLFITSQHPKGDPEMLLEDDTAEDQIDGTALAFESTYNQYDDVTSKGKAYTISPAGLTSDNYEITYEADSLTVYPKPITLNWFAEDGKSHVTPGNPFEYTYNGKYHGLIAKADPDELVHNDKVNVKVYKDNEQKDACIKKGVNKYTAIATELDNVNYTLLVDPKKYDAEGKVTPEGKAGTETTSTDRADWIINPLKVAVKSWKYDTDKKAPIYNGKDQKNLATWNLVSGDKDTLVYADNIKKNAGTYTAKITAVTDKNYTLEGVDADSLKEAWTIKPLPVQLKWKWGQTVYNGAVQNNTASITNLCRGDKAGLTYKNQGAKDAGTYKTTVTAVSNKNYTVAGGKNLTGTWTIKKAPLTVTAKAKTISYGSNPANAGVSYSGFKGRDTASVLSGRVKYDYNYARWGKPGTYKIKISKSNLSAKNYKISYKDGKLTVKVNNRKIVAAATAKGKTSANIKWSGVTGAKSYSLYLGKCDTKSGKYKFKKIATVKGTSYTVKKLQKNTFYKFYVAANTGAKSLTGHFATGNSSGKYTNVKSFKLNSTNVNLKKGAKYTLKGSYTKAVNSKSLPVNHAKNIRCFSENTKVATVTSNGVIKGVSKGWCRVYAQTANGLWKTIVVNVH